MFHYFHHPFWGTIIFGNTQIEQEGDVGFFLGSPHPPQDAGLPRLVGHQDDMNGFTLPETNSLHLKMDGWNTILSYWDGLFSGVFAVSFREGTYMNA